MRNEPSFACGVFTLCNADSKLSKLKLWDIGRAFKDNPDLENLILSPGLAQTVMECQQDLRDVVCTGAVLGIPVPGFMTALAYYDAYRSPQLPGK